MELSQFSLLIMSSKIFKFSFLYFCSNFSISLSFFIKFSTQSFHIFKYFLSNPFLPLLYSKKNFKLFIIISLFGSLIIELNCLFSVWLSFLSKSIAPLIIRASPILYSLVGILFFIFIDLKLFVKEMGFINLFHLAI